MRAKKPIIKKVVCLTVLAAMLIGSAVSVFAKGKDAYVQGYEKDVREVTDITPGGIYIYCNFNSYYTPEQMTLLYSIIDASGITNDMSKYDKAVALNNAVDAVLTCDVDQSAPFCDGLIAVQMGGRGVCEVYANLYQTVCQAVGIDCQQVCGIAQGRRHRWNVLMIDGVEYYNDPAGNDSSNNAYLMWPTSMWQERCRTATPQGDAEIYFPKEFRTVRNYSPADASTFNITCEKD